MNIRLLPIFVLFVSVAFWGGLKYQRSTSDFRVEELKHEITKLKKDLAMELYESGQCSGKLNQLQRELTVKTNELVRAQYQLSQQDKPTVYAHGKLPKSVAKVRRPTKPSPKKRWTGYWAVCGHHHILEIFDDGSNVTFDSINDGIPHKFKGFHNQSYVLGHITRIQQISKGKCIEPHVYRLFGLNAKGTKGKLQSLEGRPWKVCSDGVLEPEATKLEKFKSLGVGGASVNMVKCDLKENCREVCRAKGQSPRPGSLRH